MVLICIQGWVPSASAANAFIDPNANGTIGANWAHTGSNYYTEIDDGTRQPTTPNTADNISIANNRTDTAFFQMATIAGIASASSITVWIYHNDNTNGTTYVQLYDNAETTSYGSEASFTFRSSNAWDSITVSGLNLVQSELDGLRLRFRVAKTGTGSAKTQTIYAIYADVTYTPGSLTTDIVDGSGASVASPSVSFGTTQLMFQCQTSTGTLGTSTQKIRVSNTTANGNWTLSMAATSGSTAAWATTYDFNDSSGSPAGCSDGSDGDSRAGQLTVSASAGTLTPQSGCSSSGVTKGSSAAFVEGTTNSVTLLTASSSQTSCYYDLTGISLSQKIPAETAVGSYTINMTITITAN
jgi:hypothetical protein